MAGALKVWNAATGTWDYVGTGVRGKDGAGTSAMISTPDDGEVHLTPKEFSTGPEGTMFYSRDDKKVYVGVE